MLEETARQNGLDGSAPRPSVEIEGCSTPEQLCDRYALDAARVQIETVLDVDASRRDRNDAAQRVLALGGHSPIQKSVVVAAPINDKRIAALIFSGLREIREVAAQAQILLPEFTGEAVSDDTEGSSVEAQSTERG